MDRPAAADDTYKRMIHALTIDVEDEFNVIARDWLGREGPPTRAVVDNMERILGWLSERNIHATCFVLGEVAEAFPDLIRRIASDGHELGVHGFRHRQVFKLTPQTFRNEVEPAKRLIEDLTGRAVLGHRAPAFSIMPETDWALEVLAEVGFAYDSSIFPIRGRRYGWPDFPLDIHEVRLKSGRSIIEAPLSTLTLFGRRWPACGGGYIRHFPGALTHWALRRISQYRPVIVYLHPYEIAMTEPWRDTQGLSRRDASRIRRMYSLQRRNRRTVEPKVLSLLDRYPFAPLGEVIESAIGRPMAARRNASQTAAASTSPTLRVNDFP